MTIANQPPAASEQPSASAPSAEVPPAAAPVTAAASIDPDRTTTGGDLGVQIQNVSTWYSSFQAIHDVSLEVPTGTVTAFIGPSGCGKSTLLRWINRMNDSIAGARAEGKILVHGSNVLGPETDVVALRRRVGMVFQKPNPFPKSIYNNIVYGAKLHMKLSRSDMDDLVEWSLRKASLWEEVKDRLHDSALSLSGGQQQRLCIARAIAVGPEVLLMDEPCSALDPISTIAIEDLMRELRESYTIIIVTHNMQQASRVSDQTAFLYNGKLIEVGPTSEIFTRPKDKQTEGYVTGRFG